MNKLLIVVLFTSLIFTSCGKKEDKTEVSQNTKSGDLVSKGKELFYQSSNLTGLKCADCHSDGTNTNNTNTKYFSDIIGASKRASVYAGTISGDNVKKTGAGATLCWETFLKMGKPITPEEINALNAYYESLKGEVKEIKFTTIALPNRDKAKLKEDQLKIERLTANIQNGETKFKQTCNF